MLACDGDRSEDRPGGPPLTVPPAERAARTEAAHRGLDWLIAHADQMPPGWAHANLSRAAHINADPDRARRIAAALEADAAGANHRGLPDDLEDPGLLESERLTPTLFELLRRKQSGVRWRDAASTIAELAGRDELRFWKSLPLRHRPSILYLFEELEMPTAMNEAAIVEALRRGADEQGPERLGANTRYVYALTHVVFARSRYFRQRADPSGIEFAIPVFRAALEHHGRGDLHFLSLDLVGEVLASLELLGVGENEETLAARRRLVDAQDADGSWGTGNGVTPRRIHPTFNAVAGLLDYGDRLPAPEPDSGSRS